MEGAHDTLPSEEKSKKNDEYMDSVLEHKYRNYRMDNPPLGIQQLMGLSEVELTRDVGCCKGAGLVSSAATGRLLLIDTGCRKLRFRDTQDTKVARSRLHFSLCGVLCLSQIPYITVQVMNAPALMIRPKRINSYAMLVYDEEDRPVLEVFRTSGLSAEYKVSNAQTKAEICTIRKDYMDYSINFPLDLDVRYKIALIALCAFETPSRTSSD